MGTRINTVNIGIENFDVKIGCCEKLLGVKFGHKLTFNSRILNLCKKASKKIHALGSSKTNIIYEYLKKTYYYEHFLKS